MLAIGGRASRLPSGPRRRPRADSRRRQPHPRAAARVGAARPRPRPRALRAEPRLGGAPPLAIAQRRQLSRAGRAGALHPGGADAGRDVLRADRRPHREQRGDRRAAGALLPGRLRADRARAPTSPSPALRAPPGGRLRIAYCAEEERGALRLLAPRPAQASRRSSTGRGWSGSTGPTDPLARVSRRLRERVSVVRPADGEPAEFIAGADVVCLASGGVRMAPALIRKALAAGAVPVVSDLELYSELVGDGERGLLFPTVTCRRWRLSSIASARIARCASSSASRGREGGEGRSWAAVTDELERVYRQLVARRHDSAGDSEVRGRLAGVPTPIATSTCTPTTPRTARPRSRSSWRPPRSAASARSRSPITTRSPGRSRRARPRSESGGSR